MSSVASMLNDNTSSLLEKATLNRWNNKASVCFLETRASKVHPFVEKFLIESLTEVLALTGIMQDDGAVGGVVARGSLR